MLLTWAVLWAMKPSNPASISGQSHSIQSHAIADGKYPSNIYSVFCGNITKNQLNLGLPLSQLILDVQFEGHHLDWSQNQYNVQYQPMHIKVDIKILNIPQIFKNLIFEALSHVLYYVPVIF